MAHNFTIYVKFSRTLKVATHLDKLILNNT